MSYDVLFALSYVLGLALAFLLGFAAGQGYVVKQARSGIEAACASVKELIKGGKHE